MEELMQYACNTLLFQMKKKNNQPHPGIRYENKVEVRWRNIFLEFQYWRHWGVKLDKTADAPIDPPPTTTGQYPVTGSPTPLKRPTEKQSDDATELIGSNQLCSLSLCLHEVSAVGPQCTAGSPTDTGENSSHQLFDARVRNPQNTTDKPPRDKPRADEWLKQKYAAVWCWWLFLVDKWKQLTGWWVTRTFAKKIQFFPVHW